MKAVVLTQTDGNFGYETQELEQPIPKKNQVLVKTKAFSLNPIDLKTAEGNWVSPKLLEHDPSTLGWDGAGTIEKAGETVNNFEEGDAVMIMGFPAFGFTFADYFLADPEHLFKVPKNFSFEGAAAFPLAGLTAYQVIKNHCQPEAGKRILIHAGGGGVGHLAIQIAKHFGFYVITTASDSKRDFVQKCGADEVINYKKSKFEEVIQEPVDAVFDLIGGDYIDRSLQVLKEDGTIVAISNSREVKEKAEAKSKRGVMFAVHADQSEFQELTDIFSDSEKQVFVSKTFSWNELDTAFETLRNGHVKGKIVVSV